MQSAHLTTRKASAAQQLRLLANELVFIGVDVHKRNYHVAVWSAKRGIITTWIEPADPESLCKRLAPSRRQIAQVVYEAGPTGYSLVRALRARGFDAQVIAPSKLLVLPGPESKSDRLDCRRLAMFAGKGLLRPVHVPTEQEEADRQVIRLREQMVRKFRTAQQQIKSFLLQHGIESPQGLANWTLSSVAALRRLPLSPELRFCLDTLLDERDHAKAQVLSVTKRLRGLALNERHRDSVHTLRTVPGVGLITAMTFRTELVAPERFNDGRQVARIIGLAPRVAASGETRHEGRLLKSGNARIRTILVEATWRWVATDGQAAKRYRKLVANTGSAKKAIVGMARRLAIVLWRMSLTAEQYRAAARVA